MIFDKTKCAKCKYHGYLGSISQTQSDESRERVIYCDYAHLQNQTCLYADGKKTLDRRGTDPNKCALYEKGTRKHFYGFGAKRKHEE